MAKEYQIDLTKVKGTGKHGRIIKDDILKYMQTSQGDFKETIPASVSFGQDDVRVEPIKGFTKAMLKTMTEALVS